MSRSTTYCFTPATFLLITHITNLGEPTERRLLFQSNLLIRITSRQHASLHHLLPTSVGILRRGLFLSVHIRRRVAHFRDRPRFQKKQRNQNFGGYTRSKGYKLIVSHDRGVGGKLVVSALLDLAMRYVCLARQSFSWGKADLICPWWGNLGGANSFLPSVYCASKMTFPFHTKQKRVPRIPYSP